MKRICCVLILLVLLCGCSARPTLHVVGDENGAAGLRQGRPHHRSRHRGGRRAEEVARP